MTADALPLAEITPPALLLTALVLHILLCSSGRLARIFAFPLKLAGNLIETFEKRYNRPAYNDRSRRRESVSVAIMLLLSGLLAGLAVAFALNMVPQVWIIEALLVAMLINLRPAAGHLRILVRALESGTEQARAILGLLTGRDPAGLDEGGIAAAAIENAAQAMTRGLVAPILWYLVGGLPALFAFRMIDTASVMIDERSDHARSFGVAPRCLSALFLMPAALVLVPLAFLSSLIVPATNSLAMLARDTYAGKHAWPVFSLPVAAFAAALGVRLGGPVCIGSFRREGAWFQDKAPPAAAADLMRARRLLIAGSLVMALFLALLTLAFPDPATWPLPHL